MRALARRFRWERQHVWVDRRRLAVLAVPAAVLVVWTAAWQLPDNALELSRTSLVARVLVTGFPQGWAFFIRSPQEEQLQVYAIDQEPRLLNRGPYSEPRNGFGLDRGARKQGPELDALLAGVQDSDWRSCSSVSQCLTPGPRVKSAGNSAADPTVCGRVVVVGSTIVLWGYRKLASDIYQPTRALDLTVTCTS